MRPGACKSRRRLNYSVGSFRRGSGSNSLGSFYVSALLLQDFAYSYRVWITLIKLPYAPLR
jgi:hypothetical protein